MKRFMSTTAIVATMLAAGTMASAQSDSVFTTYEVEPQDDLFASELIGARIYASETEVGDTAEEGAEQEWDDLGEINDMILNSDGTPEVVVLGIGGFLGIGERDIAVNFDQIQIVRDGEQADDYFLVINATQEEIENAPEFMRAEPMAEGTGTESDSSGDMQSDEAASTEAGQEMNEAGNEMEQAGENAENAAEDAAASTENAAEDAANATENAAEDAANATENAADEAGQEMQEAGQEMEQAGEEMEQEAESETQN